MNCKPLFCTQKYTWAQSFKLRNYWFRFKDTNWLYNQFSFCKVWERWYKEKESSRVEQAVLVSSAKMDRTLDCISLEQFGLDESNFSNQQFSRKQVFACGKLWLLNFRGLMRPICTVMLSIAMLFDLIIFYVSKNAFFLNEPASFICTVEQK